MYNPASLLISQLKLCHRLQNIYVYILFKYMLHIIFKHTYLTFFTYLSISEIWVKEWVMFKHVEACGALYKQGRTTEERFRNQEMCRKKCLVFFRFKF
uniref:Alternative protein PFDN4 n=1 Tax=Homo sapiens TaxID=9606 RepID=L8EC97_HUMAN|nr:alternative protein PFDN4 [Homo sapiens]